MLPLVAGALGAAGSFLASNASSIISAGSGLFSGHRDRSNQREMNRQNMAFQNIWNIRQENFAREQFEYQKALNQQQMQREDTAYQRAAHDMARAGLNPLAGVQGASASAGQGSSQGFSADTSGGQAPRYEDVITPALSLGTQVYGMIRNQQLQNADLQNRTDSLNHQKLMDEQAASVAQQDADTRRIDAMTNLMKAGGDSPETKAWWKALVKDQYDSIKTRSDTSAANLKGLQADADYKRHEADFYKKYGLVKGSDGKMHMLSDFNSMLGSNPEIVASSLSQLFKQLNTIKNNKDLNELAQSSGIPAFILRSMLGVQEAGDNLFDNIGNAVKGKLNPFSRKKK